MTSELVKKIMKSLELQRKRTALEVREDGTEVPVITRVAIPGKHKLIHPQNFVEALDELGLICDPLTLEITPAKAPAPEPTPEPEPDMSTEAANDTFSAEELSKLTYNGLRAIAKRFDDVPGNVSKDNMIKLLTGKPKIQP